MNMRMQTGRHAAATCCPLHSTCHGILSRGLKIGPSLTGNFFQRLALYICKQRIYNAGTCGLMLPSGYRLFITKLLIQGVIAHES